MNSKLSSVVDEVREDELESEDEDTDPGLRRPKALDLNPNDFATGMEYVKSFVKEVRKLHRSDAHNDSRRADSLGHAYFTENLQPQALRAPLTAESLYL
jgi:hypothetical protein